MSDRRGIRGVAVTEPARAAAGFHGVMVNDATAVSELINTAHAMAAAGFVSGANGNLSCRVDRDLVAISASGTSLERLGPDEIAIVALDGTWRSGHPVASSELALHLAVYAATDARAVIHTHAPLATAVACVADDLPLVHYEMHMLGGPVRVAPYATFGTEELAAATVSALAGRHAALMANHGAVTYGSDLAAALRASEVLEFASGVYLRAAAVGTPRVLDDNALAAVQAQAAAVSRSASVSSFRP